MQTTTTQVEQAIRDAYTTLASEPGDWVSLTRLRNHLGERYNRHDVDQALIELARTDGCLIPESNQKTLTDADRRSAVWMGNQWKHCLSIGG